MNTSTLHFNIPHKLLYLFVLLFITACGGSGGGDSGSSGAPPGETTAVISGATQSIADIITSSANGASGVGGDSDALASLLSLANVSIVDNGDQGLTDDLINLIDDAMDPSSSVITRNGDVITILPSAQQVCDNVAAELGYTVGGDEYNACLQIMADIKIVITATSNNSGSIAVSHDGVTFIKMQYSPNQLIFTNDLADTITALQAIDVINNPSSTPSDLPDTVTGEIKITVTKLGVDWGSLKLEVSQTVNIVDSAEGINISLDPSQLIFVEMDGVNGEATISSTLGAISALFPVEIDEFGNELPGSLSLSAGSEITLNITDAGEGASGTVVIGPLNFKIDNQDQLNFFLDPDFTLNANTGVFSFDTPLILNVEFIDTYAVLGSSGSLDVTAPAGTTFIELSGANVFDSVYQVKTGAITFLGTGDFNSYNDTVGIGECFNFDGKTDCSTLPPPPMSCVDVSGTWQWSVTNVTSVECGDESDWFDTVTLNQTSCSLTATGIDDSIGLVTGSVDGQTVVIGPFQHDDVGGITTSTFTMMVAPSGTTMSGDESWTWSFMGDNNYCGQGTADITANKL